MPELSGWEPPGPLYVWKQGRMRQAWDCRQSEGALIMLMFDLYCRDCDYGIEDFLKRDGMREPPYTCPICHKKTLAKALFQAPGVIGDECDVTIRHGLVGPNGEPQRFRSKAEIRRVAKLKGLYNHVEHQGRKGGDKAPNHTTQRFI